MKSIQAQHSEILAMVTGKKEAKKGLTDILGNDVDLLAMLSTGEKAEASQKKEFAQILSEEGMLEDISSEDLLNFFKKESNNSLEKSRVSDLLNEYSQLTGNELKLNNLSKELKDEVSTLTFDGEKFHDKKGKEIPKGRVIKLLKKIETKSIKHPQIDTQDVLGRFEGENGKENYSKHLSIDKTLKNKKIVNKPLPKFSPSDFLEHKMTISKKSNEVSEKHSNITNLNKYNKENNQINRKLIQTPQVKRILAGNKSKRDTESIEEKNEFVSIVDDQHSFNLNKIKSKNNMNHEFSMEKSVPTQNLDLSSVSANNKSELIQKIGNYIEQSYVRSEESVDMVINHDELGQFRVQVQRSDNNGKIDLSINTVTKQGHEFFAENEVELIKSLNKSGIKLNDFKISPQVDLMAMGDSSKSSMKQDSSFSFSGENSRGDSPSPFDNNAKNGSNRGNERRRELWENAKTLNEKMYA